LSLVTADTGELLRQN